MRSKADIIAAFQAVGITLDLSEEGELIFPQNESESSQTLQEPVVPNEQVDLYQA